MDRNREKDFCDDLVEMRFPKENPSSSFKLIL